MSSHRYPTYTRLSDALERELMSAAMAEEQRISLRDLLKGFYAAVRHGVMAVFNYTTALGEALHEARSKNPSSSQYDL